MKGDIMPPENEISLKTYIDIRIKSVEDKVDALAKFNAQHFELNEQAILRASEKMDIRLEGMNQFRDQIKDERQTYALKESVIKDQEGLDARIKMLERASSFSTGRIVGIMAGFAVIPTILALVSLFMD